MKLFTTNNKLFRNANDIKSINITNLKVSYYDLNGKDYFYNDKGKVFYIKNGLELPVYFKNNSRNVLTLWNEDLLYKLQKDKIKNCNLQFFLEKALINKINRKEDRIYKGLRKAIINNSKIDFSDIRNMSYYYIYNKIKIEAKQYTRIFILDREFQIINRENLSFFEYCSKKFNVDIIIPK